jgi:hypothetical protein
MLGETKTSCTNGFEGGYPICGRGGRAQNSKAEGISSCLTRHVKAFGSNWRLVYMYKQLLVGIPQLQKKMEPAVD